MKCSNCGKEIPFAGNVCPFCHANKQGDQALQVTVVIGTVVGAVVGFGGLGALGVESFGAKLGTALAIAVVFAFIGAKAKANIDQQNAKK